MCVFFLAAYHSLDLGNSFEFAVDCNKELITSGFQCFLLRLWQQQYEPNTDQRGFGPTMGYRCTTAVLCLCHTQMSSLALRTTCYSTVWNPAETVRCCTAERPITGGDAYLNPSPTVTISTSLSVDVTLISSLAGIAGAGAGVASITTTSSSRAPARQPEINAPAQLRRK